MSGDSERICDGCKKDVDIELEFFSNGLCCECLSQKFADANLTVGTISDIDALKIRERWKKHYEEEQKKWDAEKSKTNFVLNQKMIGVYARVSTDEQNVEQQLAVLKEYCKRNNLQYRSFSDFAISREQDDRVGWNKIIKGCEEKEFDSILVLKLDRITGNLKYGVWFWDWMEQHKIKVLTLYEGVYSWDSGDNYFTFMLKILLSQKEMKDLRYRSRIGIERAKKEGKYKGGKVGRKSWSKKKDVSEVSEDLRANLTSEEKPDI